MSAQITGVGVARFGKRTESAVTLGAEAGRRALEEIGRKPVDLLVVGNMLSEVLEGRASLVPRLASQLGLEGTSGLRVEAASATGAAAFQTAVAAIEAGRAERVLVVATEKMTGPSTERVATALASALAPDEVAIGGTMPGLAALVAQRYAARYSVPFDVFDRVSVHMRAHATHNPNAQFTTPVTAAEVAASRPIALPLRLLHCAAISDGACALVVERGDGPVAVLGRGQGLDSFRTVDRPSLTGFAATRTAAERAYGQARVGPAEIDLVEVHDAFAPFALIDLEDLGLAVAGEGARWFPEGSQAPPRRLVINPSGGVLGRGHPVGVSGLVEIAEVARQIAGTAGAHQAPSPVRIGLAQSIGGLASHNFVTILGAGTA